VNPDPEAILDPLKIRGRIDRLSSPKGPLDAAVAVPQKDGIFHAGGKLRGREELEVDVEEGWAVKTNEKARLVDVVAGEGGEQRSNAGRYLLTLGFPEGSGSFGYHDDKVEIGVAVEPT
jgi:hypothetical protein